jgi:hypothetical protein
MVKEQPPIILEIKEEKQAKAINCVIFLERFDEMSRKEK